MMGHYRISNIKPASEELLLRDAYLVLLNVTRVPPHLAMAVNGKLFTLSVKGPAVEGDLSTLLRTIKQRSIESVFVRLAIPSAFTIAELGEEIKKKVLAYPRVDVGVATCLAPIKDLCRSAYHINVSDVNFIYELLPRLEEKNVIESCCYLNLEKHLQKGDFFLEKYTMEDINNEIRKASMALTI